MKFIPIVALAAALCFGTAGLGLAAVGAGTSVQPETVQHGGGCRKSSPPGQCCHMDRRAGVVHCH